MLRHWMLVDLETVGREDARAWVRPDSRLVDEKKIAASIEERCEKLAVDPNGARIVALGSWSSYQTKPSVVTCRDEQDEREELVAFWSEWIDISHPRMMVGFRIRAFDARVLIRRSQLLGVPHPALSLAKYHKGDVYDLYDEWTWHEGHYGQGVVPCDLVTCCKQFGIDVPDQHDGGDVARLVAEGNWEGVKAHCLADLYRTHALAQRLGVLPQKGEQEKVA